jgi:hypothetical protein
VVKIYALWEAPGWSDGRPGSVPGQGGRRVGLTAGEIPPTQIYCIDEERLYELLASLVLFRLVGPYLVRYVWFPSRLLLEGIGHIQNFGL